MAIKIFPALSLMDRYILSESIFPFLFGMGLFSSLAVSVGSLFDLARQVSESRLLFEVAVKILLLKMPEFVSFAFPMSVLLATLMVYSRLSKDSEMLALRSSGISVYRIVIPGVVFSLIITGLTFLFREFVVPATNYQASVTLEQALKQDKPFQKESNIIYPEYQKVIDAKGEKRQVLTRIFYAEQFDGNQMHDLTILDLGDRGVSQIVTSKSASWNLSENTWNFSDGIVYLIASDGSYRNVVRFEHQKLEIPQAAFELKSRSRDYGEMSIARSLDYLKVLSSSGDEQKIRKLKVRIQEKIAFPFICLVLGLVGAALGTTLTGTGRAIDLGICVLIVFGYYLLAFVTSSLGVAGVLPPILSAWLPNILVLGAGGLLLVRASNRAIAR